MPDPFPGTPSCLYTCSIGENTDKLKHQPKSHPKSSCVENMHLTARECTPFHTSEADVHHNGHTSMTDGERWTQAGQLLLYAAALHSRGSPGVRRPSRACPPAGPTSVCHPKFRASHCWPIRKLGSWGITAVQRQTAFIGLPIPPKE